MSAVLDASVLVADLSVDSTEGAWAEEIVGAGGLVAPHLALVEATNILRRLWLGSWDASKQRPRREICC